MSCAIYIGLFSVVITLIFFYIRRIYSYFDRLNIPHLPPKIPLGNITGKDPLSKNVANIYNQLKGKGPIGGMYMFHKPFCVPLTLDSIKRIMIKDFQHFEERGLYFNEKDEPLSAHLLSIGGEKWRRLRSKLSPAFSTGKMKFMFPTIVNVSKQLELCINGLIDDNGDLEMKSILSRYTTDVIGTCAFGIDCNSIKDPNAEFLRMGRRAIEDQKYSPLVFFILSSSIEFFNKLRITTIFEDVKQFFTKIVRETIDLRRNNQINRNDFMDILMNLKFEGDESLTFNEIAAQVFLFFVAGYETSATTMTFAMSELAAHPEIQNKIRQEINEVIEKHGGQLTYEAILDMEYLDQAVQETMRMHPPIGFLGRQVSKEYHVPDTNIVLPKNLNILVPIYGIHHDPEYFPDPEKFLPERFSKEVTAHREKSTVLSFGDGPRNCIGMRFALMQVKVGLISLLRNFEFSNGPKTIYPLEYSTKTFILSATTDVCLHLKKINKT